MHCVEKKEEGPPRVNHPTPGRDPEPPRSPASSEVAVIQKVAMAICQVRNDCTGLTAAPSPVCWLSS